MPVKKTEREEAAQKAEQATEKWSNAVLELHNQGRLKQVYDKYDTSKGIRNWPMGREIADWLMQRNIDNARTDEKAQMDPLEANLLLRDSKEIPIQKVYELARSTFSPEFVKTMEGISPRLSDSVSQKLTSAVEYKLNTKIKRFVNEHPFMKSILKELALKQSSSKDEVEANYEGLKNQLYQTIVSDSNLPEYAAFLQSSLTNGKLKSKESLYSPLMHSYDSINNWLRNMTGSTDAELDKVPGMIRPGEDYHVSEVTGVLADETSKQKFIRERREKLNKVRQLWKQDLKYNAGK